MRVHYIPLHDCPAANGCRFAAKTVTPRGKCASGALAAVHNMSDVNQRTLINTIQAIHLICRWQHRYGPRLYADQNWRGAVGAWKLLAVAFGYGGVGQAGNMS